MFVLTGPIMGTDYRITVVSETDIDQQELHQELLTTMEAVNQSMSNYLESSEVSKINRSSATEKTLISDDLASVLSESQLISEFTHGAFDITVAPLIDLWGFGPAGTISKRPSLQQMKLLAASIGYQKITLKAGAVTKAHNDTQLNLSAIAKGFAVDKVAQSLEKFNIRNYLVNIGGELRAAGLNVDNQIWQIGIEKPELLGGIQQVIELQDASVATSGDYLNFLIFEGQQYSHTINPKTLSPVLHKLASVTVIDSNASTADALATALMVMGDTKAFEFAEQNQLAAYFLIRDENGQGLSVRQTTKFADFIQ